MPWVYWVLVNLLTSGRGVAACFIVVLSDTDYTSTVGRAKVFLVFTLAALSDPIDGPLDRRLKVESTFGEILDPVCDKALNWAVLYIIWQLCDIVPSRGILLGVPYVIIAGYDFSTLALRIVKSCGYELNMKTSKVAKHRTVFFQVTLGACLAFEVAREWLGPGMQMTLLLALSLAGARILWYTYLSGREYLTTVRPWELISRPRTTV